MALSTFIFDTLDSAARLGRYILQESFGRSDRVSCAAATLTTIGVPLAFPLAADQGSYSLFWTLFGRSNQLLASLSLLAIPSGFRSSARRSRSRLAPMVLVFAITVTSLVLQVRLLGAAATGSASWLNGLVFVLLGLALVLVTYALRAWRRLPA